MSHRVLVTGFNAFAATSDNPSAHLARSSGVDHLILDVTWEATDQWISSGSGDAYDAILHLGFAKRDFLTPELFARNSIGHTPDVNGVSKPGDIEPDGPLLVSASLWTPDIMCDLLMDMRLRASYNAGGYLCNYISYRSLRRYPEKLVGFMHVPAFEQVEREAQTEIVRELVKRLSCL